MKVIICGAGQVGFNIARYLAAEANDITIIDSSSDIIQKATDTLDVQGIVGHAAHPDVLSRAGAKRSKHHPRAAARSAQGPSAPFLVGRDRTARISLLATERGARAVHLRGHAKVRRGAGGRRTRRDGRHGRARMAGGLSSRAIWSGGYNPGSAATPRLPRR